MTVQEFIQAGYTVEQNVYRKDVYTIEFIDMVPTHPRSTTAASELTVAHLDGELIDEMQHQTSDYTIYDASGQVVLVNASFKALQAFIASL